VDALALGSAVPGVWVAGNLTNIQAQVITAAAAGLTAGAAINFDLVLDETRRAGAITTVADEGATRFGPESPMRPEVTR
jgi:hypothetical protein